MVPRRLAAPLACALALVCGARLAAAQPQQREQAEPEPHRAARSGLIAGAGAGLAALSIDSFGDSRTAAGGTVRGTLGGFITPRFALVLNAGFAGGDIRDDAGDVQATATELFLGVGLRLWASTRLWIQGGVDTTRLLIDPIGAFGDTTRLDGARISGSGGYVVYQGQSLDLDLQLGLSGASYDANTSSATLWAALGLALP